MNTILNEYVSSFDCFRIAHLIITDNLLEVYWAKGYLTPFLLAEEGWLLTSDL